MISTDIGRAIDAASIGIKTFKIHERMIEIIDWENDVIEQKRSTSCIEILMKSASQAHDIMWYRKSY